jgi:hypothetical protein
MDADGSSLLRHTLSLRAGGHWPGVPRVVDGDGFGGEPIEVEVALIGVGVQAHRKGGGERERRSDAVSNSDGKTFAEELFFVFRGHWNERRKTKR